jgi:hypothetical protein
VVAAVSSEIANTAEEMDEMASAIVAALLMVFLPVGPDPGVFLGFLSCQSFVFLAGVNLLYMDMG